MAGNKFREIAITIAQSCADKKALSVRVYDLQKKSPLSDYVVLANVESVAQLEAVEEEIRIRLKKMGRFCINRDGALSKTWRVLDYGGGIVHILDKETETNYSLGEIFSAYKLLNWEIMPSKKTNKKKISKRSKRGAGKSKKR